MRRTLFIAACLALLAPLPLLAASAGDLAKIAGNPAVYYIGADAKRYVFPNAASYFSWYGDFSSVKTIPGGEMASFQIGGNVTYRPGTRMVKIQTDPKVYAVSKGGVLRHVGSEAIAACLFGSDWNVQIDDVPDAFFVDYDLGAPITNCAEYDAGTERGAAPTIGADRGLEEAPDAPPPVTPTFSVVSGTVPPSAGKEGTLMELRLRSASAVRIRQLPVRLDALLGSPIPGQATDADLGGLVRGVNERLNLTNLRWVDASGHAVFGLLTPALDAARDQQQAFMFGGTWDVPAGSDARLRLLADFDAETPSSEGYRAAVPIGNVVVEDTSGNPRPFLPAADLVALPVSVRKKTFEISVAPIPDRAIHVRGSRDVALAAFTFRSGDVVETRVRSVAFQSYVDEQEGILGFRQGSDADNGTQTRASDMVSSVRLVDELGRVVAGPIPMPLDGRPTFTDVQIVLSAGVSETFVLRGDLRRDAPIEEHDDRLSFDVEDVARDVAAFDASGARVDAIGLAPNGGVSPAYALTVRKHGALSFEWIGVSGPVVVGREALVGTLKISATHDAFTVSTLSLVSTGSGQAALTSLRMQYADASGNARSAVPGAAGAFEGLAISVPRDGSITAAVYGRISAPHGDSDSGQRLQMLLPADQPMVFASEAEDRAFSDDDLGNGAFSMTSASSDLSVRLTEIKAQRASTTPSGTIQRGQVVEVLRFSLTAAPEGAARIKKLTFRLKPSEVGFAGADNDALERWADLDGDAADDNAMIELRRFLTAGSEVLGEDATGSIRYGIVRAGALDATPQGLDSAYADQGHVEIEFTDSAMPVLAAGTVSEFSLGLKTDALAVLGGATVEASLLSGTDFLWSDVSQGFYVSRRGDEVPGLPIVSPTLTLP